MSRSYLEWATVRNLLMAWVPRGRSRSLWTAVFTGCYAIFLVANFEKAPRPKVNDAACNPKSLAARTAFCPRNSGLRLPDHLPPNKRLQYLDVPDLVRRDRQWIRRQDNEIGELAALDRSLGVLFEP